MTEECKRIIDFVGEKYTLFENLENDLALVEKYNELAAKAKETGVYPLIVTVSDTLAETLEFFPEDYDVENTPEGIQNGREKLLKESENVDIEEFFKNRTEELADCGGDNLEGEFQICEGSNCFFSYMDYSTSKPSNEILLFEIPTKNPWELAVYIPMGGFNDCPMPAEQVAVFKHWYEKYGAVPAAVTGDVWELELPKALEEETTALEVAKEQAAFCYDSILQTSPEYASYQGLASTIKDSTIWYFWWD